MSNAKRSRLNRLAALTRGAALVGIGAAGVACGAPQDQPMVTAPQGGNTTTTTTTVETPPPSGGAPGTAAGDPNGNMPRPGLNAPPGTLLGDAGAPAVTTTTTTTTGPSDAGTVGRRFPPLNAPRSRVDAGDSSSSPSAPATGDAGLRHPPVLNAMPPRPGGPTSP